MGIPEYGEPRAATDADPCAVEAKPCEKGHPLFLRPETATGPDNRVFDLIQIRRLLPDKQWEICPKTWKASELRCLEQVSGNYGGGVYRFVAQDATTHQYTAWSETFIIAGPSKPFVDERQAPTAANVPPNY